MSAQVQIKVSPTSYETTIAVLQDRLVGIQQEVEKLTEVNEEWKSLARAGARIEDALRDLEAPVHG